MRKWALAVVMFVSACAPRPVSVPVVTALKFPEFVQPPIPPAFANSPVAATFSRGCVLFQTGEFRGAERALVSAATSVLMLHPVEASLVYLDHARTDAKAALL